MATTSTTQHVQQQYSSGYSAYPSTGDQYPPGGVYTDPGYPPQNNPAYPYPVQSAPYPTSDPYPQPQVMSLLNYHNYFIDNAFLILRVVNFKLKHHLLMMISLRHLILHTIKS